MTTHMSGGSAYTRIRQSIVEGRYRPGQRLVEQKIAAEFELSRTPVREALRSLEAEGLIVSEVNRGAMVRPIDVDDIEDLYELRAHLESFAALRAGRFDSTEQIIVMDAAIKAFDKEVTRAAAGDVQALRTINSCNADFHQAVVDAARHERLAVLLRGATDVPLVYQAFRHFDLASLRRSNLFHQLIRDAIAAGDGRRAERLMAEHIDQGRDILLEHVRGVASVDALFDD
jgi:DNA-binding GntR family transcriptional regulator